MKKLAIDGGEPIYKQPFPIRPKINPENDANPKTSIQEELSSYFNINPKKIIPAVSYKLACQEIVSVLKSSDIQLDNILVPAIGAERISGEFRNFDINLYLGEADADTGNISARGIANSFTENIRVMICRHNFGHPVNFDEISMIAKSHNSLIIEDASASMGATYNRIKTGLFGDIAIFGFGESHLLNAEGDNGAILVAKDLAVAEKLNAKIQAPSNKTLQLILAEFRNAEFELLNRRKLAWELDLELRTFKGIQKMKHSSRIKHSYDKYVFRIRSLMWERNLEDTVNALLAEGIHCEAAYRPFKDSNKNRLSEKNVDSPRPEYPVANRLPKESIALPLHGGMNYQDIEKILSGLKKIEAASIK
jgi:dTDP-4-amino-4,6-dideoxygalactose transaminase